MRNIVICIVLAFFVSSCFENVPYKINTEQSGTKVVVGKFDRSLLETDTDWKEWFDGRYRTYEIDRSTENEIDSLSKGVNFVIVMGTWCGDSKREVPRFLKILDSAHVPESSVELHGIDREMNSPDGSAEKYHVTLVPTIIAVKNGKELGRIEEAPHLTLERDLLEILKR